MTALMSKLNPAAGQVVLKPRKSGPFFARHPWVLDASVQNVVGEPPDGAAVDLVTDKGQFVARGIFNGQSRIRVRLYTWCPDTQLDDALWKSRLELALALRRQLGYTALDDACRLVFSEADGLSGLIVDRYGPDLVIQLTARAMAQRIDSLAAMLTELANPRGILVRTDRQIAQTEGFEPRDGLLSGQPADRTTTIQQHDVTYQVDFREGQKTGFYLDQRDNRLAAARYLAGRRVLDVCCYTGAFGLTALRHGPAREVVGIDASAKAVAAATANAELNGLSGRTSFQIGDCFEALEQAASAGERFDAVILDPPRFAGSRRVLEQALSAYHRLNRLAVSVLQPAGILVTCSCSGHVTREHFRDMLAGVSQRTGRDIQILEQRAAAPDHPAIASCPETEYLKCLICRVL
jgi:23S rRNA (cytosine1962-C5)-methyltransferase